MVNAGAAYGITTATFNLAADTVRGFTQSPYVVYSQVKHLTGGTLFIGAQNITGGTTLAAVGAVVPAALTEFLTIWGPAGFQVAAGGATASVVVIRALSEGYPGSGQTMIAGSYS